MSASVGYSGTPLPQKLGMKPGATVCFLNPPDAWRDILGPMPEGCREVSLRSCKKPVDVFVAFVVTVADLRRQLRCAIPRLAPAGGLWIAWPKKASGVATELTETVIRPLGLAAGLVDNKVCAIDQTWSGLRFVFRLKDRKPASR